MNLFSIALGGILFLHYFALGQMPSVGKCPDKKSDVDIRKLSGVWYELERTGNLMEWPFKCITFKILPFFERKSTLKVTSINRLNGELYTHGMPLWIPSGGEKDGKFMANLTADLTNNEAHVHPVQILATDKSSKKWALAWSCRQFDLNDKASMYTETAWIIGHERVQEDEKLEEEILNATIAHHLEHLQFRPSLQTGCAKEDQEDEDESDR